MRGCKSGKKIIKQLRSDGLSEELVRLVPEVSVNGGCFGHWLARPTTLSPDERTNHWEQARSDATSLCIQDLLEKEGLPRRNLSWQDTGSRNWPAGYVGSVSHKGTKVAAVLGAANLVTSVGIDIELRSGAGELSGIPGLSLADGAVGDQEVESEVIIFSVKEAIFKAANSIVRREMDFDEVMLSWEKSQKHRYFGIGKCDEIRLDVRCSLAVPHWIVSAALILRGRRG